MQFSPQTLRMHYQSPLGAMTLAAHDQTLVGIWFDNQAHTPAWTDWAWVQEHPVLRLAAEQLTQYFQGKRQPFALPLPPAIKPARPINTAPPFGTAFQQAVWRQLLAIPAGQTMSYGEVAAAIGKPAAVRAVGAAIGRNPLSIVVPCHRVLGSQGTLTGYAGGLDRKIALLQLERSAYPPHA